MNANPPSAFAPDASSQDSSLADILNACGNGIILINEKGQIERANRLAQHMFEYREEELIGLSIEMLVPTPQRSEHVRLRSEYISAPETRPMGAGRDL